MAMKVAPHAARTVEVRAAIDIKKPTAFRPLDNERLVIGHLRERVPMVAAIPFAQIVVGGFVAHWTPTFVTTTHKRASRL